MGKKFHPTLHNGCNYLSMLGLKLIHISKRGPSNAECVSVSRHHENTQGPRENSWILSDPHGFWSKQPARKHSLANAGSGLWLGFEYLPRLNLCRDEIIWINIKCIRICPSPDVETMRVVLLKSLVVWKTPNILFEKRWYCFSYPRIFRF